MMFWKSSAVICLAALAPVAARAQQNTIVREDPIEALSRWMGRQVLLDTLATWAVVPALRPQTYSVVLRVLDNLKLPVEHADSVGGVVYNKRFIARRSLAGQRLSQWLRCGSGMTGEYADTWRVNMAYAVYLEGTASGATRVGVALFATATDMEGASKPPVLCSTTGALENEIVKKVRLVVSVS